jgi:hypothetical protein
VHYRVSGNEAVEDDYYEDGRMWIGGSKNFEVSHDGDMYGNNIYELFYEGNTAFFDDEACLRIFREISFHHPTTDEDITQDMKDDLNWYDDCDRGWIQDGRTRVGSFRSNIRQRIRSELAPLWALSPEDWNYEYGSSADDGNFGMAFLLWVASAVVGGVGCCCFTNCCGCNENKTGVVVNPNAPGGVITGVIQAVPGQPQIVVHAIPQGSVQVGQFAQQPIQFAQQPMPAQAVQGQMQVPGASNGQPAIYGQPVQNAGVVYQATKC